MHWTEILDILLNIRYISLEKALRLGKIDPYFNLPPSDDVEALLESIPVDETRRSMTELLLMMMENQEKTDKRIMALSDFCKQLNQRLRKPEQFLSKDSIIINNAPYDPQDGELISNTLNFFKTNLNSELKRAEYKASHPLRGDKSCPTVYCWLYWLNLCTFKKK